MRRQDINELADAIAAAPPVLRLTLDDIPNATINRVVNELAECLLARLNPDPTRLKRPAFLTRCGFPTPDERTEAMAAAYATGLSLAKVGRAFGCTGQHVGDRLHAAGYAVRPPGAYRKDQR